MLEILDRLYLEIIDHPELTKEDRHGHRRPRNRLDRHMSPKDQRRLAKLVKQYGPEVVSWAIPQVVPRVGRPIDPHAPYTKAVAAHWIEVRIAYHKSKGVKVAVRAAYVDYFYHKRGLEFKPDKKMPIPSETELATIRKMHTIGRRELTRLRAVGK
jgi:hypothetical protein